MGQGQYNEWIPTTTSACGTTKTGVTPGPDMFFCAGGSTPSMHFNDAYDDNGGFDIHSWRIRRPFDFANRTGVIAFDVGGKAQIPTGHGWWFNVFIADEPVPAPYQQGGAIALYTRAGVGIEFEAAPAPCHNADGSSNSVSHVFVEKDYAMLSELHPPDTGVTCFKTQEEILNHIEIRISQSQVEVFASDAGNPQSFRRVVSVGNLALPLTRGYVSFQHTHYNANKANSSCPDPHTNCPITHSYNTYHWDNIGFDGPTLPAPRAYEVPDNTLLGRGTSIGYVLGTGGLLAHVGDPSISVALTGVDLTNAADAVLTLNAWSFLKGDTIGYRFNGGAWRTFNHPFPTSDAGARAVAIPVQLSDLRAGNNTLEMNSGSGAVIVANAELTIDVR